MNEDNLFLEIIFEGLDIKEDRWKEFVDKWELDITTDLYGEKKVKIYNKDHSINIIGESMEALITEEKKMEPEYTWLELDVPTNDTVLMINDKIESKRMLSFLNDFLNIMNEDDLYISIHDNKIKGTIHPKKPVLRFSKKNGNK